MNKVLCHMCKEEFTPARSMEEALKDSMLLFGDIEEKDRAILCEDCFATLVDEGFVEWWHEFHGDTKQ